MNNPTTLDFIYLLWWLCFTFEFIFILSPWGTILKKLYFKEENAEIRKNEITTALAKYQILGEIGKGTFALVKKAINIYNQNEVAIKIIARENDDIKFPEAELLSLIDCRYCVSYKESFCTDENIYIIMENLVEIAIYQMSLKGSNIFIKMEYAMAISNQIISCMTLLKATGKLLILASLAGSLKKIPISVAPMVQGCIWPLKL